MLNPRPWLSLILASACATAAAPASAASLGAPSSAAVLGQRLDFSLLVRLDPGESLAPECLSAEVAMGERVLPRGLVRAVIERHGVERADVRVQTLVPVEEPVIDVAVTVGCGSTMTRRYVLLADPPDLGPALPPTAPAFAAAPVDAAAASQAPAPAPRAPTAAAPTVVATAPATTATPAPPPAPAPRARPQPPRSEPRAAAAPPPRPPQQRPRPAAPPPAPQPAATPRLQLDMVEPAPLRESEVVEQAIAAVAQAASAARAAASAASLASQRIAALERSVEQLTTDAQASREVAEALRAQLSASQRSSLWVVPLLVLTLLLAALAAWLAWRLAAAERQRQQVWRVAVAAQARAAAAGVDEDEATPSRQPTMPIPVVHSEIELPARRGAAPPAWPPAAPAEQPPRFAPTQPPAADEPPGFVTTGGVVPPESRTLPMDPDLLPEAAMQRTLPLPPALRQEDTAARDVSIEELIDLEQQAEFFTVLGQDDAAIDLLVDHLRQTGGGSPLPYLKLLEIYHRRGDHEHYDRMRTRFNQRFNAFAPEWGVDLQGGRSLEDYAGVLPRLQQVWDRPLDAMAELEVLLFRKSRGELFDLPAYRDVLFLYSLARDLLDRESADSGNVDLLLPLADIGEFGSTAPAPFRGDERESAPEPIDFDNRPTLPVDFDLTTPERQSSLFDPLDEPRRSRY